MDLTTSVSILSFFFLVASSIVGFFWTQLVKVKENLQEQTSVNDTQKEKIAQLEKQSEENKINLKEHSAKFDNTEKQLLAMVSKQGSDLETFIKTTSFQLEQIQTTLKDLQRK